jgi:hypothetical protein
MSERNCDGTTAEKKGPYSYENQRYDVVPGHPCQAPGTYRVTPVAVFAETAPDDEHVRYACSAHLTQVIQLNDQPCVVQVKRKVIVETWL